MSAAVVNGLVLLVTALLLMVIVHAWAWPPDRWLYLQPEAERALRDRAEQFQNELREAAKKSPRAAKRKIVKRDVKAEYYRRRKWPGKAGYFLEILRKAVGGIIFGAVGFVVAVLALPFLAKPFPVVAGTAGYAGPPLAALAMVVAATKFLNPRDVRRDSLHVSASQQSSGSAPDPAGEGSDPVARALDRYRERVTRATRNHALSTAARKRSRREVISKGELESAWGDLVIPYPDTLAPSGIRSRTWIVSVVAAALVVAVPIYLIFVLAIPKLPLNAPWRLVAVAASLLILYGLMRAIVGAWRHHEAKPGRHHEAEPGRLARAASAMVNRARMILPRSRPEKDTSMPLDPSATSSPQTPASASPDPPVTSGPQLAAPASPDPSATSGTQPPAPGSPATASPASKPGGVYRRPPDSTKFAAGWWLIALTLVAAAAVLCVVVARGTHLTTAHRAAAAWVGLLVVATLAVLAQAIVLWYQSRTGEAPGRGVPEQTLAFRRRGLKAAVMGQDGRASTSKTQVVFWTAAIVWALIDLLLLARTDPNGNLFTNAVTNWRPEYLVLLGLPVAAATTAKAVVASTNSGRGPIAGKPSAELAGSLGLDRVYMRDPVPEGVWGFLAGVAELFTGDDGEVAWADLQYVVFTLITLVYFTAQFLARPAAGLPPVPAALLTLMGVSATAYAANKIVNTRGVNLKSAQPSG